MNTNRILPGTGGNRYLNYEKRTGEEAVVYFTRDLSEEGLNKIYLKVSNGLSGRVAVKLHTGEKNGPNIIPRPWVKSLLEKRIPDGTIVETNTYYEGDRYTTALHRETLKVNGWTFSPVDILDEEGTALFPVRDGKWFTEMSVGNHLLNYDSLLTLTHFKGHVQGGFGGSNKNLGIGCADGRIGKKCDSRRGARTWDIAREEFMERMTESTKSVIDHFAGHIAFINVMRNMSVSCDCEGCAAAPVVTPNVGIVASEDILAADQACVDLIYAMKPDEHHDLIERMESRYSLRQLSYMKELGMGHDRYVLKDIDNQDREIVRGDAVKNLKPFRNENG